MPSTAHANLPEIKYFVIGWAWLAVSQSEIKQQQHKILKTVTALWMAYFLLHLSRGGEYCDQFVCLCVCLSSSISRVSNRSGGMISSRFPGDIYTKIQQNLQFYRHLPGRVTNPWDHTDPVYPSNSSVKGHLQGIDSSNIN